MKPIRLTEYVKDTVNGGVHEKLMLISPDSIASVKEDKLIPYEQGDGIIPMIDKNFSSETTPCRRVSMKTGQQYGVKESLMEIESRWIEGWNATEQASVPPPMTTRDMARNPSDIDRNQ